MTTPLKSLCIASIISVIVLIGSISTSYALDIWPGGVCKAANLNQAKQLSWSLVDKRYLPSSFSSCVTLALSIRSWPLFNSLT